MLVLARQVDRDQPVVLSEFGGIALAKSTATTWGYSEARDADDLRRRYAALLAAVRSVELFAGFCYTQFADTWQEANGLLYADRTPKFAIELIALATHGHVLVEEQPMKERDLAP